MLFGQKRPGTGLICRLVVLNSSCWARSQIAAHLSPTKTDGVL